MQKSTIKKSIPMTLPRFLHDKYQLYINKNNVQILILKHYHVYIFKYSFISYQLKLNPQNIIHLYIMEC